MYTLERVTISVHNKYGLYTIKKHLVVINISKMSVALDVKNTYCYLVFFLCSIGVHRYLKAFRHNR